MDPNRDHGEDEDNDVPEDDEGLRGHKVGEEQVSDGVQLVTSADEDERGQEDIDDGVVGDEDQHPAGVRAQEDVVLSYQHLHIKTTYTKENQKEGETGVSFQLIRAKY